MSGGRDQKLNLGTKIPHLMLIIRKAWLELDKHPHSSFHYTPSPIQLLIDDSTPVISATVQLLSVTPCLPLSGKYQYTPPLLISDSALGSLGTSTLLGTASPLPGRERRPSVIPKLQLHSFPHCASDSCAELSRGLMLALPAEEVPSQCFRVSSAAESVRQALRSGEGREEKNDAEKGPLRRRRGT